MYPQNDVISLKLFFKAKTVRKMLLIAVTSALTILVDIRFLFSVLMLIAVVMMIFFDGSHDENLDRDNTVGMAINVSDDFSRG